MSRLKPAQPILATQTPVLSARAAVKRCPRVHRLLEYERAVDSPHPFDRTLPRNHCRCSEISVSPRRLFVGALNVSAERGPLHRFICRLVREWVFAGSPARAASCRARSSAPTRVRLRSQLSRRAEIAPDAIDPAAPCRRAPLPGGTTYVKHARCSPPNVDLDSDWARLRARAWR
jgi:hypothetical protein